MIAVGRDRRRRCGRRRRRLGGHQLLLHGRAAGRGAARLDGRLLQRRPRPERRPEDRGHQDAAQVPRVHRQGRPQDRRRPARALLRGGHLLRRVRGSRLRRRRQAVARLARGDGRGRPRRGRADPGRGRAGHRCRQGRGRACPRWSTPAVAPRTPRARSAAGWSTATGWSSRRRQEIAQKVVDAADGSTLAGNASFERVDRRGRRRRLHVDVRRARAPPSTSTSSAAWAAWG